MHKNCTIYNEMYIYVIIKGADVQVLRAPSAYSLSGK